MEPSPSREANFIRILSRQYPFLTDKEVSEVAQSLPADLSEHKSTFLHTEIAKRLDSWGLMISATLLLELAGRGSKSVAVDVARKLNRERFIFNKTRRLRNPDQSSQMLNETYVPFRNVASKLPVENYVPFRDAISKVLDPDEKGAVWNSVDWKTRPPEFVASHELPGTSDAMTLRETSHLGSPTNDPALLGNLIVQLEGLMRDVVARDSSPPAGASATQDFEKTVLDAITGLYTNVKNIEGTLGWLKSTIDTERQLRRYLQEHGPLPEPCVMKPGPEANKQAINHLVSDLSRNYYGREGNPVHSRNDSYGTDEPGENSE